MVESITYHSLYEVIVIVCFPYYVRICQWRWTSYLWGMADTVDGHTQAPGRHLK